METVELAFKCIWLKKKKKEFVEIRITACSWTAVIPVLRRLCKTSWQDWFSPFPWHKITLDISWEKEVPCRPCNKTGKTAQILLLLNTWNFQEQTGWGVVYLQVLHLEISHLSLLPQQQGLRNQRCYIYPRNKRQGYYEMVFCLWFS